MMKARNEPTPADFETAAAFARADALAEHRKPMHTTTRDWASHADMADYFRLTEEGLDKMFAKFGFLTDGKKRTLRAKNHSRRISDGSVLWDRASVSAWVRYVIESDEMGRKNN